MYGHAGYIIVPDLDFSGVQSGPDLKAQGRQGIADGTGALDSSSRSIESREEPIASGVDFPTPESF
jgi:hypothetical protein